MRTVLVVLAIVAAGCASSPPPAPESTPPPTPAPPAYIGPVIEVATDAVNTTMQFVDNTVPAPTYGDGLYEPTMEVSDTGVIYVTGHTTAVDTTGAPVYMSHDDGASWSQLPFLASAALPNQVHGATPPPSDEIFLVAGDDGYLYGVDITLGTYPINAWAGDGAEHVYHNPNGYDRVESTVGSEGQSCNPVFSLNDRPWAAYGGDKLFVINNPGGGPMQIGVMDVPVSTPIGAGNVQGPTWNLCASDGGWIPGVPDMRDDLFFAAPQVEGPGGNMLHIVTGSAEDIYSVEQIDVMPFTHRAASSIINGGHVAFGGDGAMFVGVMNNTQTGKGQFKIATSIDNGTSFVERTIETDGMVSNIYLDGNMAGPGALMAWAVADGGGHDYFVAHMFVGHDGGAVLENINLVLDNGPAPSAHVQSAAVGPDGRAHLVFFRNTLPGGTPLSVMTQTAGPTMPLFTD